MGSRCAARTGPRSARTTTEPRRRWLPGIIDWARGPMARIAGGCRRRSAVRWQRRDRAMSDQMRRRRRRDPVDVDNGTRRPHRTSNGRAPIPRAVWRGGEGRGVTPGSILARYASRRRKTALREAGEADSRSRSRRAPAANWPRGRATSSGSQQALGRTQYPRRHPRSRSASLFAVARHGV